MPVVADIDGVQTEIFPIVDEFGVIVFDGDAELYTTTDGRQVRVVCASGRLANADPTNEHAMPAMPTTQPTPPNNAEPTTQASAAAAAAPSPGRARRDDSEEALWSSRRTRFLIEKYKENFRNIGKKGGLRNKKQLFLYMTDALNEEFECSLSVLQVTNKWKSLERAYKRARENNRKSGSGTVECRFEEEMADIMDKQHHVSPIVTYTQGCKMVREDKETEPEARVQAAAPASQESSAEETAEVQKRKAKDPPLVQLLRTLEEIEKKQGCSTYRKNGPAGTFCESV
ncbi:uncharacterized protein LOC142765304 [Rhipicephalus microplus]|uniref:uncharacterized protein LOC142765304 n=1 Tax=Rhipicephalus microplus TaxID=6941 RepID=UPI003F6CF223